MTRIDFYQIETNESAEAFCCRLVSKAWRQGHHVYIHTGSEKQARTLDDLLWTFRRESFIPHGLMGQGDVEQPVEIGSKDPGRHTEVMINLTDEIPDFFSRFERLAEIVPFEDKKRDIARKNYQFYKHRGYPIQYHKLSDKNSR